MVEARRQKTGRLESEPPVEGVRRRGGMLSDRQDWGGGVGRGHGEYKRLFLAKALEQASASIGYRIGDVTKKTILQGGLGADQLASRHPVRCEGIPSSLSIIMPRVSYTVILGFPEQQPPAFPPFTYLEAKDRRRSGEGRSWERSEKPQ